MVPPTIPLLPCSSVGMRRGTQTDTPTAGDITAANLVITFRVSRRQREMYCGHAVHVRLCVCLSAVACPHYCTDPDVTWGMPPSYALLGGFAIGTRVALLWQHNVNANC